MSSVSDIGELAVQKSSTISDYISNSSEGIESLPDEELAPTPLLPPENRFSLINLVLWTLGSIFVTLNVEVNGNLTGILVSVRFFHVILMILFTMLLGKGLKESRWTLVLPWVCLSFWNLYHQQLGDVIKIYHVLSRTNLGHKPWLAWMAYSVAMYIRLQLTIRVMFVTMQQWYTNKLRDENTPTKIKKTK